MKEKPKGKLQSVLLWYSDTMEKQKKGFYDFVQKMYITFMAFITNDLATITSAGAYNFLLSAVPIFILVLIILLQVLHANPKTILAFLQRSQIISIPLGISDLVAYIGNVKNFAFFESALIVFIFWMSRRFFASIQHSIRMIYKKQIKIEPFKVSIIVIIGEIALVIFIVFSIIILTAGNAVFKTELPKRIFSPSNILVVKNAIRYAPIFFLLIFLFTIYYFMPPVRPTKTNAFFCAATCSLSFLVLKISLNFLHDRAKFDFVYGFFSNFILLLAQVWFFFFFFVFFAQFMYVTQYFNSFITSYLYCLPKHNDPKFLNQIIRSLFIEPPQEYKHNMAFFKKDTTVFSAGEATTDIYYIISGTVSIIGEKGAVELQKGDTFGEFACMVEGKRLTTAKALTDVLTVRIPEEDFLSALSIDGNVSRQALQALSEFVLKEKN
ncbi:YhjD/YihY/BrkB family envelope integrity protein [Treponema phagedenis]|uniref:Cyclic nucleotide-binding domain protein n=2 Tax=Treponema phagedenis TaxID=162 RepID=A0A0B7GVP9_TREPH|nr:YhjD/YihY/BrkB family envelope integrity protein [Treponema phagedenis]EFW36923.1 cyclic nucleotide-binding domain protein [Treponema phagedenis F0421]CEM61632.1 Cyclic nucleotide-binding domain protein [Treponema phagedenis]